MGLKDEVVDVVLQAACQLQGMGYGIRDAVKLSPCQAQLA